MSPLPGVSQRANQRLFKAETVQCPFYHATCLESICVCLKCVWKTEWLVHNRWQIVWCCKSVYNYYVYTICAEKSQYQSLRLLPTQLTIVLRLWKSRDTLKSSKNAFNWISESSKIFSRFDRKREYYFMNFCIYLLYVLSTNLWNDCIHIMIKSIVSVFFSRTQAYLWSTCSEGQLVWPSVLRCRWRWMREAGSCWRTDHSASSYRGKVTLKVTAHTQA